MPEQNPPGDDWQFDDVDWFDHARRPSSQPAAGEAPQRQRSGLIPEADRDADDQPSPASGRHADIRRRRIAALAVLGVLFVCAVVVPLVVFGGGGNSAGQTTPLTTALTTTTTPTTTQARTTTTTTTTTATTTPSNALRVTLPAGTTLKRGDSGAAVTQLQKGLVALGFSAGTPDGTFGATTEAAVVDFQQSNSLPPDGIVGTDTVRLLNAALASKGAAAG